MAGSPDGGLIIWGDPSPRNHVTSNEITDAKIRTKTEVRRPGCRAAVIIPNRSLPLTPLVIFQSLRTSVHGCQNPCENLHPKLTDPHIRISRHRPGVGWRAECSRRLACFRPPEQANTARTCFPLLSPSHGRDQYISGTAPNSGSSFSHPGDAQNKKPRVGI